MEIHNNSNKQLNDLLGEARREKPVMNFNDVEKIISEGKYIPTGGNRGWHIGMNNMIVLCGIVVSSFLAYMALKVDKGDLVNSTSPSVEQKIVENGTDAGLLASDSKDAKSDEMVTTPVSSASEQAQPVSKSAERIRPKQNSSTLLASSDNHIVSDPNEAEENVVTPVAAKMPSGEYIITFNYEGQDIRMKLVGDEVSEFFVDGKAISSDQYGDFDDILAEGKNYLVGNIHEEEGSSSLNLIKYFDSELRRDHILDKEVQYEFELSSSQLIVNNVLQPGEIFKKYKGLYEDRTGKVITKGSVYKFERGAKSE